VTGIVVRDASPADERPLRRLAGEAAAPPPAPEDVVFVAELDGHPAGYLAVRRDGASLVIDQLVVPPADRGRHVGNHLLDWAEGYGTSHRLATVRIRAGGVDRVARDFYLRRGYTGAGDELARELTHL
jgi:GNAT superfamily N-acetyltransferase